MRQHTIGGIPVQPMVKVGHQSTGSCTVVQPYK